MPIDNRSFIERFQGMCKKLDNGCIEWTGYRNANGYGRFKPGQHEKSTLAHRWSYEYYVAPIPPGLVIDHLCRNRSCVNHEHLEPVAQVVNIRRGGGNVAKTHCPQGHAYAGSNVMFYRGARYCRECTNARRRVK